MIPPFVQNLINGIENALKGNTAKLECVDQKLAVLVKYSELDFGRLGEGFVPRDSKKLQFVREKTIGAAEELKVRDEAGYHPRDGYIANLGDDSFKVILFGVDANDSTSEFTIPPNVSYAIRSPISKIKIIPQDTLEAVYQVSVI